MSPNTGRSYPARAANYWKANWCGSPNYCLQVMCATSIPSRVSDAAINILKSFIRNRFTFGSPNHTPLILRLTSNAFLFHRKTKGILLGVPLADRFILWQFGFVVMEK